MPGDENYGPQDIRKHYVRKNGWLPASLEQESAIKSQKGIHRRTLVKEPLRYFTFCAAGAIDVFLLAKENILKKSLVTGRLEGVYFCERDEKAFGIIAELIGSPDQGFSGDFIEIMLFQDDKDTLGKNLYEDESEDFSEDIREKLKVKDTHTRLKQACPFDIINFDVCGVMFPAHRESFIRLLKSLKKFLEWQTEATSEKGRKCQQFTLFLTSHLDRAETDDEAISQLCLRLERNIHDNQTFRDAFVHRFGHTDVVKLAHENFAEFFCLAFPKYVIHDALFQLGWRIDHKNIYLYDRQYKREDGKTYKMMHSVATFKRVEGFDERLDVPNVSQYNDIVNQLMNTAVKNVEVFVADEDTARDLESDIANIILFRDASMSDDN